MILGNVLIVLKLFVTFIGGRKMDGSKMALKSLEASVALGKGGVRPEDAVRAESLVGSVLGQIDFGKVWARRDDPLVRAWLGLDAGDEKAGEE
jgi:hypothetical protein